MTKNIKVKRGDIVWLKDNVPYYEFGGSVQSTSRPYVVISNDINNEKCTTINIASISKAVKKAAYPMHVYLDKNKYGLKYNSVVFTEQVKTIPKNYIKEKVASLDKEDIKKLNQAVYVQMINEHMRFDII